MYSSYSPSASLKKARDVSVSLRLCSIIASKICIRRGGVACHWWVGGDGEQEAGEERAGGLLAAGTCKHVRAGW